MARNLCRLAATIGLILFASAGIQAAESQIEKKAESPPAELNANEVKSEQSHRQQARDNQAEVAKAGFQGMANTAVQAGLRQHPLFEHPLQPACQPHNCRKHQDGEQHITERECERTDLHAGKGHLHPGPATDLRADGGDRG